MKMNKLVFALCLSAALAACSAYGTRAAAPAVATDGVLAGSNGMTLYTFDKDAVGKSACNGACATNWPPFYAKDSDTAGGDYSIILRDDGKKQWALKGRPLYYWSKDKKVGDQTGDGFNSVWRVARP